jgi:hypothetical protein
LDLFQGDNHTFFRVNGVGAEFLEVLQEALAVLQIPFAILNDDVFASFDIN